jgi:hypothetical protein
MYMEEIERHVDFSEVKSINLQEKVLPFFPTCHFELSMDEEKQFQVDLKRKKVDKAVHDMVGNNLVQGFQLRRRRRELPWTGSDFSMNFHMYESWKTLIWPTVCPW